MIWFLLAPLSLLFKQIAYPLAPLLVLTSIGRDDLPRWLAWFATPDNTLDGDAGHMARWAWLDRYPYWLAWYVRRVAWLWRNTGYGFSWNVCGKHLNGRTHFLGDRRVSDNPMHAGWCWAYNSGAWELYVFWPWLPSIKRGLRLRIGWAVPLTLDSYTGKVMLKTHFHPAKRYS